MRLDMYHYNRLIEITGGNYNARINANEDGVMLFDSQSAIEDLITEFDVLQEEYLDMREKIVKKIDELKEHKFMIDMIDRWSDGDEKTWEKCVDQITLLESMLENDREQD